MSVTDWLYMLSVIHLIVYSFLDLSVCRTLLPICLSERIFFSETQVRESSKWSDGHLSIRQICLSAYSVYLYTHLSVCLFVCLFVCLVVYFIIHWVINYVSPCCEKPVLSPFVF